MGVKRWRGGDKYGKMEGHCLRGQSPKWAVAPMEEEDTMRTTGQQVVLTKSQELRKWKNSYTTSKKL
jgi:hypothetical protein